MCSSDLPVVASVPVYYRNNRGVLLGSDTVLISQGSLSITPNPRLIPANHTLISAASVTVMSRPWLTVAVGLAESLALDLAARL